MKIFNYCSNSMLWITDFETMAFCFQNKQATKHGTFLSIHLFFLYSIYKDPLSCFLYPFINTDNYSCLLFCFYI